MRLLSSLTLGAVVAAWVVTTAATAPQPELVQGTPHAAIQEDQPGWNCTTMGNRVCGPGYDLTHEDTRNGACWAEKVHGAIEDVEIICGDRGDRPATDTADIGATVWVAADPLDGGREPWVVTVTGLEPDSTN